MQKRSFSRFDALYLRLFSGVQLLEYGRVVCNLFPEEEMVQDTVVLSLERVGSLGRSSLNKEPNAILLASIAFIQRDLHVPRNISTHKKHCCQVLPLGP